MKNAPLGRRLLRPLLVVAVACALLAGATAGASAATTTIGASTTDLSNSANWTPVWVALSTTQVIGDQTIVAPVSGTISTWRVQSYFGGPGSIQLLVLRPNGGDYDIVAASASETPTTAGLNVFSTSLPIQAGDTLAVSGSGTSGLRLGGTSGVLNQWTSVAPTVGTTLHAPTSTYTTLVAGLNADITTDPVVTSAVAATGPTALGINLGATVNGVPAGTGLTVRGANMDLVTAVYFNTVKATQWWIDGYEQITVVVPPGLPDGPVTMRVGGTRGVDGDTPGVQVVIDR